MAQLAAEPVGQRFVRSETSGVTSEELRKMLFLLFYYIFYYTEKLRQLVICKRLPASIHLPADFSGVYWTIASWCSDIKGQGSTRLAG